MNVKFKEVVTEIKEFLLVYQLLQGDVRDMRMTLYKEDGHDKIFFKTEMHGVENYNYIYTPKANETTQVEIKSTLDNGDWVFKMFANGTLKKSVVHNKPYSSNNVGLILASAPHAIISNLEYSFTEPSGKFTDCKLYCLIEDHICHL